MSNGFLEIVEIRTRPRHAVNFIIFLLIPAGLLSIRLAELALRWKVVAVLSLVIAVAVEMRSWPRSVPDSRATLLPHGRWQLCWDNDRPFAAHLVRVWGASLGPIIGLEWNTQDGHARRIWVFRRDLPEREWRRLRVHLRLA